MRGDPLSCRYSLSAAEASQSSMMQKMHELVRALVEVVINRWQGVGFSCEQVSAETGLWISARNQVRQ